MERQILVQYLCRTYLNHLHELGHRHRVGRLGHDVSILEAQRRIDGGGDGGEGRQAATGSARPAGREQKMRVRGRVVVGEGGWGHEERCPGYIVRGSVASGGGGGVVD